MHFFRSLLGGLMVACVALALPTGNTRRSLSVAELEDIYIRALEHVKFGPQVAEENKASIEAAVRAHHDALPEGHEHKNAKQAEVYKDWHHTTGEDTSNPKHATLNFYKGSPNGRNKLGGAVHINKPERREYFDDGLYIRTLEHVKFGPQVAEENKATLEAAVRAHHAALPEGHEHKNAKQAEVYKDWHHTTGEDTKNPQHATLNYYKGSPNGRNKLGGAVHINKPERREYFDEDLFTRTLEHVKFGPQVSEENKATLEAAVRAHHAALPDGHEHKNAKQAEVYKDWHHTTGEDTNNPQHATLNFYKGSPNGRNKLGGAVHINKPARR